MKICKKLLRNTLLWDVVITVVCLTGATLLSLVFLIGENFVNMVGITYMTAIAIISNFTDGWLTGTIASFISLICLYLISIFPGSNLYMPPGEYPMIFAAMIFLTILLCMLKNSNKKLKLILKNQEETLKESEKESMRANLLRAISHDLRTPLTGIIGAGSTYLDNSEHMPEKEKNTLVSNIRDDANWLLNMVENLLSVTRMRNTGARIMKRPEPIEEVVSESVQRFHKRLPEYSVCVSVPSELVMVPMDVTLIEQVIINLLENAAYHSNSTDPAYINVSIQDGYAWFEVRDRGGGISSKRLATLFDGNSTVTGNDCKAHKGMGIGLSICKTIVVAHNGTIQAANDGSGAVFTFTLPLGEEIYE